MKFNNLVNDVINKEELALVYGGANDPFGNLDRACNTQACSKLVGDAKDLCNADAVCAVNAV